MDQAEPTWYEALKEEPLRGTMFTNESKRKVMEQAMATMVTTRRLTYVMVWGSTLVVLAILVVAFQLWHPIEKEAEKNALSWNENIKEGEWLDAINKENSASTNEILSMHRIGEDRQIVFFKKTYASKNIQSVALGVNEYVRVEGKRWRIQGSISDSGVIDPRHPDGTKQLTATIYLLQDVNYVFGILLDPAIKQLQISDDQGGIHEVRVFDSEGARYWYNDSLAGGVSYTLEGLNEEGKVITEEQAFHLKELL